MLNNLIFGDTPLWQHDALRNAWTVCPDIAKKLPELAFNREF